MQIKKEDVKNSIMASACEEFLEKGFLGTSLNAIAARADLSKGAIYSYFKSKDDLFYNLVEKSIIYLKDYMDRKLSEENSLDWINNFDRSLEEFIKFSKDIEDQRKELKLLLFCSEGSNLGEFREELIQSYHRAFDKFLLDLKFSKNPFTEPFIHTLARIYISFIEEIVLHNPDEEDISKYAKEMAVFMYSGFVSIIKIK